MEKQLATKPQNQTAQHLHGAHLCDLSQRQPLARPVGFRARLPNIEDQLIDPIFLLIFPKFDWYQAERNESVAQKTYAPLGR